LERAELDALLELEEARVVVGEVVVGTVDAKVALVVVVALEIVPTPIMRQSSRLRFPPWNPPTTHLAVKALFPVGTCSATDWLVQFQMIKDPALWNLQPSEPFIPTQL